AVDAGGAGHEHSTGPHILVSLPYLLSEVSRVLAYPRLQTRWQLGEQRVEKFVGRVGGISEIAHTAAPDRIVPADPDDDPSVQTAVLGRADILCTRDRHLLDASVGEYCAPCGRLADGPRQHSLCARHTK